MKYVAVVGSRSITDKEFVFKTLDYYLQNIKENICLVSGGANGVDKICREYWKERPKLEMIEFLPDYENNPPKLAPLLRNTKIVNASDYLIAITTGSRGTADSIKKAQEKGIPIRIIKYETT